MGKTSIHVFFEKASVMVVAPGDFLAIALTCFYRQTNDGEFQDEWNIANRYSGTDAAPTKKMVCICTLISVSTEYIHTSTRILLARSGFCLYLLSAITFLDEVCATEMHSLDTFSA